MPMRIFISDKMSPEALSYFTGRDGFEITYDPEITMEQLAKRLHEFDALVIRSRTRVTREMLQAPGALKIIGRAGAGVDNVDVEAATEKGVIVMNTPGGNTLSTAEHSISMMLSLARRIPYADATMKAGKWAKSGIMGVEMADKTLGVVGMGKIGREVVIRMQAFGMSVLVYDPFLTREAANDLGVELADIDTLCKRADVITVHAPLNNDTRGLINAERLAMLKPTALLVNCARGGIVDEQALYDALKDKKLAGAALDVFEQEPLPEDHPLRKLDNAVLTPHLAASTTEAQEKVARDIAIQIFEALSGGVVRNAVNAPSVDSQTASKLRPALDLVERMGRFVSQYARPTVQQIDLEYIGTMAEFPTQPLTTAFVKGFLVSSEDTPVNEINAMHLIKQRGVRVTGAHTTDTDDMYTGLISVTTISDSGEVTKVSGTLYHGRHPKIVSVGGKRVDATPAGHMLVLENRDIPGIIGLVGTMLGNLGVNIAAMSWGRTSVGGDALTVINTDQPLSQDALNHLKDLPNVLTARHIVV